MANSERSGDASGVDAALPPPDDDRLQASPATVEWLLAVCAAARAAARAESDGPAAKQSARWLGWPFGRSRTGSRDVLSTGVGTPLPRPLDTEGRPAQSVTPVLASGPFSTVASKPIQAQPSEAQPSPAQPDLARPSLAQPDLPGSPIDPYPRRDLAVPANFSVPPDFAVQPDLAHSRPEAFEPELVEAEARAWLAPVAGDPEAAVELEPGHEPERRPKPLLDLAARAERPWYLLEASPPKAPASGSTESEGGDLPVVDSLLIARVAAYVTFGT